MNKLFKTTFGFLILVFFLIISSIFTPLLNDLLQGPAFLILLLSLLPLSLLSFFLLQKSKFKKEIKKLLKIASLASLGFSFGSVLHNFFYALSTLFSNTPILKIFFEILHTVSFLLATLVSPLVFVTTLVVILYKILSKK